MHAGAFCTRQGTKRVGTRCLTCISFCHSHLESVMGLESRAVEDGFLATEEPSAGSLPLRPVGVTGLNGAALRQV